MIVSLINFHISVYEREGEAENDLHCLLLKLFACIYIFIIII